MWGQRISWPGPDVRASNAASVCSQQRWSHSLCRRQNEGTGKRWLQEVQLRDASQGLTVSPTSVSGPKTQPYPTVEYPLPPLPKGLHPCLGQGVSHRGRTLYFNRPFI